MTIDLDAIRVALAPLVEPLGLSLYDVELTGSGRSRVVRVSVDREGGVDLAALSAATHAVEHDVEEMIQGAFQLEVSSPGLERHLARPDHYRAAIDNTISVKFRDDAGVATRVRGRLTAADDTEIRLTDEHDNELVIAYSAIVAGRTIFEWGPAPRPGRGSQKSSSARTPQLVQRESTRS